MTIRTRAATAVSSALLCIVAVGCGKTPDAQPPPDASAEAAPAKSFIGRKVAQAIDEAGKKLRTGNIRLGEDSRITVNGREYGLRAVPDGLPGAEITPAGELLIGAEPVPATAEQQQLLLVYRRQLEGVALAGMAIGAQGADIAGTALTGIGEALFGGEEGRKAYEARIETEAGRIEQEALKLCLLLPQLFDSQQALAASLPAFAPYATMTPEDVEDCGKDSEDTDAADSVQGALQA